MNHFDPDTLARYCELDLPLPRQREVDLHLVRCAACASEVTALRQVDAVVAAYGSQDTDFPAITDARIRASIQRRRRLAPLVAFSRMVPMAVGSSIAAVLVLASLNLGILYPGASAPVAAPTASTPRVLAQQTSPLRNARRTSALLGSQPVPRTVSPNPISTRLKVN